jgi:hypothetical protein
MSHLSFERLAALADEQPTADEHLHLSHCAECARELDAHRSLLAKAGAERESMGLPLTRWETLSRRLRAEGLIVGSGMRDAIPAESASRFPLPASRLALQIAATLLLVAGGAVLGRVSAGASVVPGGLTGGEARLTGRVGSASVDSLPTTFASVEEARRWKSSYEDAYQKTVSFLAANDSAGRAVETPAVMRARLSALDRVQRTMGEALKDAPYDPVINNYYLNSFGEREATLRMLNNVLPQGVRMNSF